MRLHQFCFRILLLMTAAMTFFGCARTVTVTVPPRVDLRAYPNIGVIGLAAKPEGELARDATQKFLGNLQAAQPGVRLLELGSAEQVLHSVGAKDLDFQAIRAIGRKYGVAAVLGGSLELSEVRPDFNLSPNLNSASASAKIDGKMNAKLWEADSGATVWNNSSWGTWTVGGVKLAMGAPVSVDFHNPEEKRDQIVMELVKALNHDFWPTYERRRAP